MPGCDYGCSEFCEDPIAKMTGCTVNCGLYMKTVEEEAARIRARIDRSHPSHDMRGTSLESYTQVELGEGQKVVYDALWEHTMRGVYPTDRELTKTLDEDDPNKIRPRRFELMERGLIEEAGKRPCEITGRKALTWRIKRRDCN